MHLADSRRPVDRAAVVVRRRVHHHRHLAEIAGGDGGATEGVHGIVGTRAVGRPLRPDKDDRHRRLEHEPDRRRRVGHRVGAVGDDHPGDAGPDLVIDRPGEFPPERRLHILREDACDLAVAVAGDVPEFRDRPQDIARRELAHHRAAPVVHPARDRPAGGYDGEFREVGVLDDDPGACRRLRGGALNELDLLGRRPDVVAALQFDDGHPVPFGDIGAGERGTAVCVPHQVSGLESLHYAANLRAFRIRSSNALDSADSVSSAHSSSRARSSLCSSI